MAKLKPKDPLAEVRANPAKVKRFDLNPADARNHGFLVEPLTAFPEELLACKALESLAIFRGIRGPVTIPDRIGELGALKKLSLGGLALKALPESIGKLKNLTDLSLDYDEQLARRGRPEALSRVHRGEARQGREGRRHDRPEERRRLGDLPRADDGRLLQRREAPQGLRLPRAHLRLGGRRAAPPRRRDLVPALRRSARQSGVGLGTARDARSAGRMTLTATGSSPARRT